MYLGYFFITVYKIPQTELILDVCFEMNLTMGEVRLHNVNFLYQDTRNVC